MQEWDIPKFDLALYIQLIPNKAVGEGSFEPIWCNDLI